MPRYPHGDGPALNTKKFKNIKKQQMKYLGISTFSATDLLPPRSSQSLMPSTPSGAKSQEKSSAEVPPHLQSQQFASPHSQTLGRAASAQVRASIVARRLEERGGNGEEEELGAEDDALAKRFFFFDIPNLIPFFRFMVKCSKSSAIFAPTNINQKIAQN